MSAHATWSLLVATAIATALFHTLIPDHWLPFVLIGRARGWSAGVTAVVSGVSAAIHTGLSAGLGLLTLVLGIEAAGRIGETLEASGAALLVSFGLLYAWWAWRKGGHFHPGGRLAHRTGESASCPGSEGGGHPEHLHYHADQGMIRGRGGRGGLALAAIVGVNPCVLILPVVFRARAEQGPWAVAAVLVAYSLTTMALMIGLSVAGVLAPGRIRLPAGMRHMETASGLVIALAGVVFWLMD